MFKTFFTLTALIAISMTSFAQNEQVAKTVTRTFGLALMTDIHNENDIPQDLQYPQIGLDFSFNKKVNGKIFEKGFSLGWQPINTTNMLVDLPNGEDGELRATNQIVHGHFSLRTTVLRNHPLQPYIEGIVGFKGAALSSSISDPTNEFNSNDIPFFDYTWNAGVALGIRWEVLNRFGIDIRYARIKSGKFQSIDGIDTIDNEIYYSTHDWKIPVGYLRAGVSLAI